MTIMQSYLDLKARQPGTILLFKIGEVYESYFEDAENVSRYLRLPIVTRRCGEHPQPTVAFPVRDLEPHLRTLIETGVCRVALCEQEK